MIVYPYAKALFNLFDILVELPAEIDQAFGIVGFQQELLDFGLCIQSMMNRLRGCDFPLEYTRSLNL